MRALTEEERAKGLVSATGELPPEWAHMNPPKTREYRAAKLLIELGRTSAQVGHAFHTGFDTVDLSPESPRETNAQTLKWNLKFLKEAVASLEELL
jgi:hypothetical protein